MMVLWVLKSYAPALLTTHISTSQMSATLFLVIFSE
jgi:hypothetical protein